MVRFGHHGSIAAALLGAAILGHGRVQAQELTGGAPPLTPAVLGASAATAAEIRRSEGEARSGVAVEPHVRPERKRSGGESLEREMRRRLEAEERRMKELIDELNERLLRELFRDTQLSPEDSITLGPDSLETPSTAFLRAVSPPEASAVRRRGFDRWATKQLLTEWNHHYRVELSRRRASDPHPWPDELDAEDQAAKRALNQDWPVRWDRRFPAYWQGHPSASDRAPVVVGEELEIARVGKLSVGNDMDVHYDLREVFYTYLPEPKREPERRGDGPAPSQVWWRERREAPRGNVYTGEFFRIDARARLALSGSALETGTLSRVGSRFDCTFFDSYDHEKIFGIALEYTYEPDEAQQTVSLMCELVSF